MSFPGFQNTQESKDAQSYDSQSYDSQSNNQYGLSGHDQSKPPSRSRLWLQNAWPAHKRASVDAAYRQMLDQPEFQLIVEDLARYANLRSTGFVAGQADQTAFNEGQRDLVLHLIEMAGLNLALVPRERLIEPA